jgi:membrane protease YdiL (CAAX protease family)
VRQRLYGWYGAAPVATAGAALAALATVRVAGAWSTVLMTLSMVVTPAVLVLVPRRRWPEIGLVGPGRPAAVTAGLAVVGGAYAAGVAGSFAAFGRGVENWLTWVPALFAQLVPGPAPLRVAVALVCLGLVVPVLEEVCYRGVLFDAARRRAGPTGAVVITALVWAAVHLGDYGLNPLTPGAVAGSQLSVFAMGLALGYCRLRTGSVVACVVAQGAANLALYGMLLTAL